MSLNLGELAAIISVDDSEFDSGLDGAESKFSKFGGRLKLAGAAIGAAAAAALAAGLAQALEFEAANDKMAASLRLTEDEAERAGNVAGDLYAGAYGSSIEEVNEALRGIIAQTRETGDVTDGELEDMGATALNLASIFGYDVTQAIQVAGQMVKNGLAADMTEAFDIIAAGSAETMPGLQQDVMDAANEYGVFFAQLGMDGAEAFGALAAASENGEFAVDKTGDALKEFTLRASDMSSGSVAAFDAIGLDAEDMAGRILAGGDTARGAFDQIVDGLLDMEDPVARQTAALALFGTPLEDLSTAQIPDFLSALDTSESALQDVGGAAEEMGDTLNDNAATGFESLKRSAMDSMMDAMEPMIPILQWLIDVLDPIAPVLGVLAVALGIAALATMVFNAALWANPIVWIIAAVIALIVIIVLLVQNWDTVSAAIIDASNWLKDMWVSIFTAIGDFFVGIWNSISDFFVDIWNSIKDFFVGIWNSITSTVVGIWNSIKAFFVGIWNAIVNHARNQVNAILAVVGWFKDLPGKVSGWFQGVKDAAVNKMTALVDWVKGLPGRIKSALGDLGDLLKQAGRDLLNGLKDGIMSAWDSIQDTLADLTNKLPDWKGPASKDRVLLTPVGEMIIQGLVGGFDNAIPDVRRKLQGLTTDIGLQVDQAAAPRTATGFAGFTPEDRQFLAGIGSQRTDQTFVINGADTDPGTLARELDWLSRRRP